MFAFAAFWSWVTIILSPEIVVSLGLLKSEVLLEDRLKEVALEVSTFKTDHSVALLLTTTTVTIDDKVKHQKSDKFINEESKGEAKILGKIDLFSHQSLI